MMANEEPNAIASIDEHEQLYDVFLSFRGSDTRLSFTGNLFNALRNKRFKTFMDNDGLKSGNQILPSIFKALERSRVAIVVLSKNYAASTYCLDELVNILECKKTKNQLVFPIFYDVHPFEVRYQTGSYDVVSHEYRFGKDQKLQSWKAALSEVSTISGLHFENRYLQKCEYELIHEIVEWVSNALPRYDVFLSFSEDTCYSFSSYLFNALDREGFKILMKDNKFKEGEDQRSQSLVTTIEKSRLSIIILSKNYAYSSSRLNELVNILDFMKTKNQLVWPIFYKVEPSDIRHQKNSYENAMNEHENTFGKDSQNVKIWSSALFEVANLKGWHFKYGYSMSLSKKLWKRPLKFDMLVVSAGKKIWEFPLKSEPINSTSALFCKQKALAEKLY